MDAATVLTSRIRELTNGRSLPLIVALDGRSGAGKSTLATRVAPEVAAAVIDGDDFYSGGTDAEWDGMSAAEKVDHCIDWRHQRPVLEALALGDHAEWHPYDWQANDGSQAAHGVTCGPAPVIILEGVYSARPELADLLDLSVLYDATDELRRQRLVEREGEEYRKEWNARWEEAEVWYFGVVMRPEAFDLVIPAV